MPFITEIKIAGRRKLCACLALLIAVTIPQVVSAANTTFSTDTTLNISGPGINLLILSGSQSDSLAVTSTTFTVTVAAAESFTVRYPGPSAGELVNNGGLLSCNLGGDGSNTATVTGPATVIFTPNTTPCPAGGGSSSRASTPAYVSVSSPDGGEIYTAGSEVEIKWSTNGTLSAITINLSADGGATYATMVSQNLINTGSYRWVIPADYASTTRARVKVEAVSGDGSVLNFDTSNGDFEIRGATVFTAPKPLLPVNNVQAFPGDQQVLLRWANPTEADFAGVRVVRKKGSPPSTVSDGLTIYDGTSSEVLDMGAENGVTYFYAVYAYGSDKKYAAPVAVKVTPFAEAIIPSIPDAVPAPTPSPTPLGPEPGPTLEESATKVIEFVDLPDVLVFKPGNTVPSNYILYNNGDAEVTVNLARSVLDPDGSTIYTRSGYRIIAPSSSERVETGYQVAGNAVSGLYTVVVEVSRDAQKLGQASFTYMVEGREASLASRLSGRILLDVQSHGEAWYVNPKDLKRYYLGRPEDAYVLMRALGLGITNENLATVPVSGTSGQIPSAMIKYVSGYILLQVESRGEAWYVDPIGLRRHYMSNGRDAYNVMRSFGLGITSADLSKIPVGSLSR